MGDYEALRAVFERLLTVDSETRDRRRREFNQAIFFPADDRHFPGHSVWSETDLGMVLEKFDAAVREVRR